jgi:phosphoserine aminotransferase
VPPTLDLSIAIENSRLDQTYNTPGLATLFLLDHQLQWILGNGGLEFSAGRCDASAGLLYGWADAHEHATPFVRDRANGVLDVEPYRKLGRNQLRNALFPSIDPDDVERLTRAIDYVIERIGSTGD